MLVQDDALFPAFPVLSDYVALLLTSTSRPDVVSLYTSAEDMQTNNGWRCFSGVWKYGAVALIFRRAVAQELLHDIHQGRLDLEGNAGIDLRIGLWANHRPVTLWHPSPSLVQHIGQVSSIWKRSRAVGLRRASRFIADELSVE